MFKYLFGYACLTGIYFSPDTGAGQGGSQTSNSPPPDKTSSQGSQTSGSTPGQTSPAVTEDIKKNPEELLKVIGSLTDQVATLTAQRDKGENTLKEIKEKSEKQRQKELTEQGNFKKLHEEAQTRLTQVESENKALTAAVAGFLKDAIAGVSPELQKKLQADGYKDNPLKQLELLTTLKEVGAFQVNAGKGDGTQLSGGGGTAKFTDIYKKS